MALWDVYSSNTSVWIKRSGYSLGAFYVCLPWLVDDKGWKDKAREYEVQLGAPIPKEVAELFSSEQFKVSPKEAYQ